MGLRIIYNILPKEPVPTREECERLAATFWAASMGASSIQCEDAFIEKLRGLSQVLASNKDAVSLADSAGKRLRSHIKKGVRLQAHLDFETVARLCDQ